MVCVRLTPDASVSQGKEQFYGQLPELVYNLWLVPAIPRSDCREGALISGLWPRMSGELHYHSHCFGAAQGAVLTPPAHTAKSISPAVCSEELWRCWEGPVLSLSQPGSYSPVVSFHHRISCAASSSSLALGSGFSRLPWLIGSHISTHLKSQTKVPHLHLH